MSDPKYIALVKSTCEDPRTLGTLNKHSMYSLGTRMLGPLA